MSHTVKIQTAFKSMRCLKQAFEKLGWKLVENSKIRSWYNNDNKTYPLVAKNPVEGFDLGIEEGKDEIKIMGDLYGGSIQKTLGENLSKLKQEYATQVIDDEMSPLGYMINVQKQDNGFIIVECEK